MTDSHLKEQYANPFAAEQARRKLQKLTEQHYHGNGMHPPDRTAETLDAMLLAIDGLRAAVKQMNAALVEMRAHAEPKVVTMPARALRHGSPQ